MTRNVTYTGQLSAKINEKYEKHTMAMKDWQALHDRMHASQRHLRKLNEDIKEPGYTKYCHKIYQIPELTKIWKAKQQEKGQLKTNIKKQRQESQRTKTRQGPYLQTRKENSSPGEQVKEMETKANKNTNYNQKAQKRLTEKKQSNQAKTIKTQTRSDK